LLQRGFDQAAIDAVLREVPKEAPENAILKPQRLTGGRPVLVVAGLAISVLGLCFVIGNRTGAFPTVPFFGFALMVFGGVMMALSRS
jgi:hypothetical protein